MFLFGIYYGMVFAVYFGENNIGGKRKVEDKKI